MNEPNFFDNHPSVAIAIGIYVVLSGLLMFATVRRPLVAWCKANTWFIRGDNILDVLIKQIGMRLSVEGIAFVIACVIGSLGGNIYTIRKASRMRRPEAVMDE